jgi:hypothetical protein
MRELPEELSDTGAIKFPKAYIIQTTPESVFQQNPDSELYTVYACGKADN